jgi:hypothetical protein
MCILKEIANIFYKILLTCRTFHIARCIRYVINLKISLGEAMGFMNGKLTIKSRKHKLNLTFKNM